MIRGREGGRRRRTNSVSYKWQDPLLHILDRCSENDQSNGHHKQCQPNRPKSQFRNPDLSGFQCLLSQIINYGASEQLSSESADQTREE